MTIKKRMKCYVLMIAKQFPAYHPKAGLDTEFGLSIKYYEKRHTLRSNYELWAKRFEKIDKGEAYLSVREWAGKPYKSIQQEIFRYDRRRGIGLEKLENPYNVAYAKVGKQLVQWAVIAQNDGLSFEDFSNWFPKRRKEPMAIIHFTDFRYSREVLKDKTQLTIFSNNKTTSTL